MIRENQDTDPFIYQVEQLNKFQLIPQSLFGDIVGYHLPLFPEINRNHYDERPQGDVTQIKCLVMHYTVDDLQETLNIFTKDVPDNRASSSYVITEGEPAQKIQGGEIIQVAPDQKRTWHAGVSQWRDMINLNGVSLGIEHVNKGFIDTPEGRQIWFGYDVNQIHASGLLSKAIVETYNISPINVVGHQDIAPGRKHDPGILFPWGKLHADYGVGAWLTKDEQTIAGIEQYKPLESLPSEVNLSFLSRYLKRYGYLVEETDTLTPQLSEVVKAFKVHFSQNQNPDANFDVPDMNDMFWIWGLMAKYRQYL